MPLLCYLSDEDLDKLKATDVLPERKVQDYRSTYNEIRDWLRKEKSAKEKQEFKVDWDDVVFDMTEGQTFCHALS